MRFWAAVILVLTSPSAIQAAPPEMKPIDDFLLQNETSTNGPVEVFVGLRCFALYALLSRIAAENDMAETAKAFKDRAGAAVENVMKFQKPYNDKYTGEQVELIGEAYIERFRKATARTGNSLDDEVFKSDLKTCGEMF